MTEPIYRLDRSKPIILTSILNTLFDPDIASVVRPWLEVTNTETGGQSEQTNFALTAHTLPSLAIILIMY